MSTQPRGYAALYRVRGAVAAHFLARHATSAEDAVAFAPKGWLARRTFDRYLRMQVLREPEPGRFYLDLRAYHLAAEALSRRAVPIALVVSVAVAAAAMLFYRG